MPAQSVLVLGAGELGSAVLHGLAARRDGHPGTTVDCLLRPATIASADPAKRRHVDAVRGLGVGLVPGDLGTADVPSLAAAFRPYDTVIGCTGFVAGPGTQLKLARAALAAGIGRYLPWQFGVDYDVIGRGSAQDLFDEQLDVRDLLRAQSAVRWVIVSTGMFTGFLFDPTFGVVDRAHHAGQTVHALGDWDTAVTVTTAADIGAMTAEVVLADPPVADGVVYLAGDTITYGRLADVVGAVTARPVRRVRWDLPRLRAELAADPGDATRKYRVVFAEGRGVAWDVGRTFNARRGADLVDVPQWATRSLT